MSFLETLGIVFLAVLILISAWRRLGNSPNPEGQTIDEVKRFIHSLRVVVGNNGVLTIYHQDSRRFIPFEKIARENKVIVSSLFPETEWSQDVFPAIQDLCRRCGYETDMLHADGSSSDRFLEVRLDFSNEEAEEAVFDFTREVLGILGVPLTDLFTIHFSGDMNYDYSKKRAEEALNTMDENKPSGKIAKWAMKKVMGRE